MDSNSLVNTLAKGITALEILRCEPAADSLVLEIGVEAVGEALVFR